MAMQNASEQDEALNFFMRFVEPAIGDWRRDSVDVRLAMNIANSLNNLVEYYWHAFATTQPDRVFRANSLKEFRAELTQRNEDIALIRDIADAHKHLKLNRADRTVTNANQTKGQIVGYGQAYGLCYGSGELLVVTLDDGEERYFALVAESTYAYWSSIFQ
jgi:hypothetical protein